MNPSLTKAREAVIKITDNERKVLETLADAYDQSGWDEYGIYTFDPLQRKTGLDRRHVRLACRSLQRKGLAKYVKALWNDDGPAGAGYGATQAGFDFINPPPPSPS